MRKRYPRRPLAPRLTPFTRHSKDVITASAMAVAWDIPVRVLKRTTWRVFDPASGIPTYHWRLRIQLSKDFAHRVRTRRDPITRTAITIVLWESGTVELSLHGCGHDYDCCGCLSYTTPDVRPAHRRKREFIVTQSATPNY